ncbi:uncharacterized protein LOC128861153 [Anastrepha ludens]|uniref:uncharacterized protein LOC128861153 n=1 Tax=Anastrepha ludens TaxID=28586 RepID=UPI0023AF32C7|nr:uncharacterized protein LOC128861153 [Anastrepha ludens]
MSRTCRVRGCYLKNSEVKLFSFPQDPIIADKWRQNLHIARTEHLPPHNSFVCVKHFEACVVGGQCLKKGAIPTLRLGHDDDPTYSCTIPKKQRSVVGYVVEKGHTLYEFPRGGEARNSWALACDVQPADSDRLYVCKRHFSPEQVTRYKVLDGAVPSLRLEPVTRSRSPSTGSDWVCPPVTKVYVNRTVGVGVANGLTLEEFAKYSMLEETRQVPKNKNICEDLEITSSSERFAQAARYYRSNEIKLKKRIQELEAENEKLLQKYKYLCTRAVLAEETSSSDAVTFARMIVSGQKNRYSEEEKTLAQNINYMSSKAYTFMRDDLGFALPHK